VRFSCYLAWFQKIQYHFEACFCCSKIFARYLQQLVWFSIDACWCSLIIQVMHVLVLLGVSFTCVRDILDAILWDSGYYLPFIWPSSSCICIRAKWAYTSRFPLNSVNTKLAHWSCDSPVIDRCGGSSATHDPGDTILVSLRLCLPLSLPPV
jgi:hypothetical protein